MYARWPVEDQEYEAREASLAKEGWVLQSGTSAQAQHVAGSGRRGKSSACATAKVLFT